MDKIKQNIYKNGIMFKILFFLIIIIFAVIITLNIDNYIISCDINDIFAKKEYEIKYNQQDLYSNLKDFSLQENVITSTSNDSWIYLDTSGVNAFKYIKLDIEILNRGNVEAQIFYIPANIEDNFREDRSILQHINNGINYIILSYKKYSDLRIDLTYEENVMFIVNSVELTNKITADLSKVIFLFLLNIIWIVIWYFIIFKLNIIKKLINKNDIEKEIDKNNDIQILKEDISITKESKDENLFKITIIIFIIVKLILVMGQKIYPILDAGLDDGLMYKRAVSIISGNWLGEYDHYILTKGAFFSLWLAFLNIISMPMLIGNQILYIFSCLFLIWCIDNLANKKILLFIFAVLLFNPSTFSNISLVRIYREGIYQSLIIFIFAGMIGAFLFRSNIKKMIKCSTVAGLGLAAAWHTREDTFWVLPFIISAIIITGLFIYFENKKNNMFFKFKTYVYLLLPVIFLLLSNILVSSINFFVYGRFVSNDYRSKDFQSAYGALTRVAPENFQYQVPVSKDARIKIYQVSPAFNELKKYLDDGRLDFWKVHGEQNNDYDGGWFFWALRDAVALSGYYENPQKAKEYYNRLAREVNEACDNGLLPTRTGRRATLATPYSNKYLMPTIKNTIEASLFVIKFKDLFSDIFFREIQSSNLFEYRNSEYFLNQPVNYLVDEKKMKINGWTFDESEKINIKILENKNNEISFTLIKNDSTDVFNHFNGAYKNAMESRFSIEFYINTKSNYYLNIINESGEQILLLIDDSIKGGRVINTIYCFIDDISSVNNNVNNIKTDKIKNNITNIIIYIYRIINPIITLIAIIYLIIITINIIYSICKKSEIIYKNEIIILWGLILSFILRSVMIAYINASSFTTINVLYLLSSYPIMILFNCISIYCLYNYIKSKVNKGIKQK